MAKRNGGGTDFERDFGYLLPFLDKVAGAVDQLSGPAREELAALVQGEKARWTRIRELLAGAPGRAPVAPTAASRDLTNEPAPRPRAKPEQARAGFTVGSLRGS